MLIIAGSVVTAPDDRQAFLDAVQPMVTATLQEAGCQDYAFTPDPRDDSRILLFELWDDDESLAGHFASEHMAAWQQTRKTLKVSGATLKKYTIDAVEAL